MLNDITRPAAQELLRLRLQGKLFTPEEALRIIGCWQPADGFDTLDFFALADFIAQLDPCTRPEQAQQLACKYALTLAA